MFFLTPRLGNADYPTNCSTQVDELIEKPKQIVEKLADKVSEEYEPSINRDQTRLEKRTESSPRPPISQVPEAAEDQQLVFEKEKEIFSSEPVADLPEVVSNEVPLVDYLEVLDPQSSTEEQPINVVTPKTKTALVRRETVSCNT